MSNKFTEELGNFWGCLSDEQLFCCAPAHFGSAAGMVLARANFCADCAAGFCRSEHMNMVKMTAPKPLQDKALSKGGEG